MIDAPAKIDTSTRVYDEEPHISPVGVDAQLARSPGVVNSVLLRCLDDLCEHAKAIVTLSAVPPHAVNFEAYMKSKRGLERTWTLIDAINADSPTTRLDELSDRELEVLKRLSAGESHAQVALGLSISPLTVKSHTSSIRRKLRVDRTETLRGLLDEGVCVQCGRS